MSHLIGTRIIYCFIECGNHFANLLIIWHIFIYLFIFYHKYPISERQKFKIWMRQIWAIYWYQNLKNVEVSLVVQNSGQDISVYSAIEIPFSFY